MYFVRQFLINHVWSPTQILTNWYFWWLTNNSLSLSSFHLISFYTCQISGCRLPNIFRSGGSPRIYVLQCQKSSCHTYAVQYPSLRIFLFSSFKNFHFNCWYHLVQLLSTFSEVAQIELFWTRRWSQTMVRWTPTLKAMKSGFMLSLKCFCWWSTSKWYHLVFTFLVSSIDPSQIEKFKFDFRF
jgi:hypothetical protein